MKKVKYEGAWDAIVTSLSLYVKPGDVLEVPDDFKHKLFSVVEEAEGSRAAATAKGDK